MKPSSQKQKMKMPKVRKHEPRRQWSINPAQKAHSSPNGKKTYNRYDQGWKKEY